MRLLDPDRFSQPFDVLGVVGSGITREASVQATLSGRLNNGILHRSYSSTKGFTITSECTLVPSLSSSNPNMSRTTRNWILLSVPLMPGKLSCH